MIKNCLLCDKSFTTYPSRVKIGWGKYCGKICQGEATHFKKGDAYWQGRKRPNLIQTNAAKTMFVKGTQPWNKGREMPEITGEKNRRWKGDDIHYTVLHKWINKIYGRPKICQNCEDTSPETKYHWANKTGKYLRDRSDWYRLCALCHRRYDLGRIKVKEVMPLVYTDWK